MLKTAKAGRAYCANMVIEIMLLLIFDSVSGDQLYDLKCVEVTMRMLRRKKLVC